MRIIRRSHLALVEEDHVLAAGRLKRQVQVRVWFHNQGVLAACRAHGVRRSAFRGLFSKGQRVRMR
jgi:hypothetical protein